jgi:hypothetical protein
VKIENEANLAQFRTPGFCDWCGKWCRLREAAHIFARGLGDARRIDMPFNVAGLGRAFECICHKSHHDGNRPLHCDLLAKVAAREGLFQGDIETAVYCLWRLPHDYSPKRLKRELAAIPRRAAELVQEAIAGHQPGSRRVFKRKWPKRRAR